MQFNKELGYKSSEHENLAWSWYTWSDKNKQLVVTMVMETESERMPLNVGCDRGVLTIGRPTDYHQAYDRLLVIDPGRLVRKARISWHSKSLLGLLVCWLGIIWWSVRLAGEAASTTPSVSMRIAWSPQGMDDVYMSLRFARGGGLHLRNDNSPSSPSKEENAVRTR